MCRALLLFLSVLLISCNKEKNRDNDLIPADGEYGPKVQNESPVEGYSDKISYFPGDSVYIMASSASATLAEMNFYRNGKELEPIFKEVVAIKRQDYFKYSYSYGCDWDTTFRFKLSEDLSSGLYSLILKNPAGNTDYITFVVKEPRQTKEKDILVIANTNTWQAYNTWGGASFYRYELNDLGEDIRHSVIVSFHRPNKVDRTTGNKGHLANAEMHLLRWLEENQLEYAMASDADFHGSSYQLEGRKLVILHAHPEYYSSSMLDNIGDYLSNGGNLMYLGGNGLYWRVTLSDNNQIECRKDGDSHKYEEGTGGLWRDFGRSPALIVGSHYSSSGYGTYHPYEVLQSGHWVFEGTDLNSGDLIGEEGLNGGGASGHETDKTTKHTPDDFILLAKGTNPNDGGSDMLIREAPNGSIIFSTGSISYTGSLSEDVDIHRITMNVIEKCLED